METSPHSPSNPDPKASHGSDSPTEMAELERRIRNRDYAIFGLTIAVVVGFGGGYAWLIAPALGCALIGGVLWARCLRQLERIREDISNRTRERVLPDVQRASGLLVAVTSLFLLGLVHLRNVSTVPPEAMEVLVGSVIAFSVSLVAAVSSFVATPVYRVQCHLMVETFERFSTDDERELASSLRERFRSAAEQSRKLERVIFALFFLQPLTFLLGVVYFVTHSMMQWF